MNTQATLPSWQQLAKDAHRHRLRVLTEVLRWRDRLHPTLPTRLIATVDALQRPLRYRLARLTAGTSPRDRAAAPADDLHDAVAQTWALVGALQRQDVPGLELVLADLVDAGRWLAAWPVVCSQHDEAAANLFGG